RFDVARGDVNEYHVRELVRPAAGRGVHAQEVEIERPLVTTMRRCSARIRLEPPREELRDRSAAVLERHGLETKALPLALALEIIRDALRFGLRASVRDPILP